MYKSKIFPRSGIDHVTNSTNQNSRFILMSEVSVFNQ